MSFEDFDRRKDGSIPLSEVFRIIVNTLKEARCYIFHTTSRDDVERYCFNCKKSYQKADYIKK